MKITYLKQTKVDLEIKEISLLTFEEAERLPESIREYGYQWWLQSRGYDFDDVAVCYKDGDIDYYGETVSDNYTAVRPVLTIRNLESLNLEIGDMLTIQGLEYLYVGNSKALYNDNSFFHRFDAKSNIYETSEIKKIVDNWLK